MHKANGYEFSNVKDPEKIWFLYPVESIGAMYNKPFSGPLGNYVTQTESLELKEI